MLPFPEQHKEIAQQLLNGRFILQDESLFDIIRSEEYRSVYKEFFDKTFSYDLVVTADFIYLKNENSKETVTRDFTIFLALICRELYKDGKDFKKVIETEYFEVDIVERLLKDSSRKEIIEHTGINQEKFANYLNDWSNFSRHKYAGNEWL